jgi:phage shock protein A
MVEYSEEQKKQYAAAKRQLVTAFGDSKSLEDKLNHAENEVQTVAQKVFQAAEAMRGYYWWEAYLPDPSGISYNLSQAVYFLREAGKEIHHATESLKEYEKDKGK